jgi:hypothetical protein
MSLPPSEIIKNAWKKTPEALLMHCMHILGMMNDRDITPDELTELIRTKLSRPDQAIIRRAVYDLLHNVA